MYLSFFYNIYIICTFYGSNNNERKDIGCCVATGGVIMFWVGIVDGDQKCCWDCVNIVDTDGCGGMALQSVLVGVNTINHIVP